MLLPSHGLSKFKQFCFAVTKQFEMIITDLYAGKY